MKTKKNYIALLESLELHKDLLESDSDLISLSTVEDKIFTRELIEDYGWSIPSYVEGNCRWFRLSEEFSAGTYGKDQGRTISWEDNGKQPNSEFLLCVSYSTGAYYFGEYYDKKLFAEFFQELVTFNPKYKDSENKALYFTKEVAGKLLEAYGGVKKKYQDRYNSEANSRKVQKLKEELSKLENVE